MDKALWERIEPILDGAMDLDGEARQAYLDEACGEDLELRREVESMIFDCGESESFLAGAGGELIAEATAASSENPAALRRVGRKIGPWRLVDILGQGGMGTVYLAERDDGHFDQRAAIKIANRLSVDADGVEGFRVEQQILARLEHPDIARLYDGGIGADGLPFLIMEYVDGEPLDVHCSTRRLGIGERAELVAQVADAVAYAHRRQVVHRDLKPSNVLVTSDGTIKLLDFGVAELLDSDSSPPERSEEAQSSQRMTLGYASPERLRGEEPTAAGDLYSLGALAYRLLCGELPFVVDEDDVTGFIHEVCEEAPRRPRTVWLEHMEEIPGRLDRELEAIVLKALSKAPEERYESASEFADDLRSYLSQRPVKAISGSPLYALRKAIGRHRRAVLAGVLAFLALTVVSKGWIDSRFDARRRTEMAQRFGQEAERLEGFLRQAHALPLHDIERERVVLEARMRRIAEQMVTLGSYTEGPGHFALGRAFWRLHDLDKAEFHLDAAWEAGYQTDETAVALGRVLGERYRQARLEALSLRDPTLRVAQLEEAQKTFRDRAVSLLDGAGRPDFEPPEYVSGLIALYDGRFEEALRLARASQAAAPWFYEAWSLESDALLGKAQERALAAEWQEARDLGLEALDALVPALRTAPSDASLWEAECDIWLQRGEWSRFAGQRVDDTDVASGLTACAKAREADRRRTTTRVKAARLLLARTQSPGASRELRQTALSQALDEARGAVAEAPGLAQGHAVLGTARLIRFAYGLGESDGEDRGADLDAAIDSFRQAVELNPAELAVRINLGTALAMRGEQAPGRGEDESSFLAAAAEAYENALERIPTHFVTLHNLATLENRQAQIVRGRGQDSRPGLGRALALVERGLAINEGYPPMLNLEGVLLEAQAQEELIDGGDPTAWLDRAEASLRETLEARPDYYRAEVNLGSLAALRAEWALRRGESPDRWIEAGSAALDRAGEEHGDAVAWLNRGELMRWSALGAESRGEDPRSALSAALSALRVAAEKDPGLLQAQVSMVAVERLEWEASSPPSRVVEDSCLQPQRARIEAIRQRDPQRVDTRLGRLWIDLACAERGWAVADWRELEETLASLDGARSADFPALKAAVAVAVARQAEDRRGEERARQDLATEVSEDDWLRNRLRAWL